MEREGIEPNLIMLNVLINAFGNVGKYLEALSIYHHIKECVGPLMSLEIYKYETVYCRNFFLHLLNFVRPHKIFILIYSHFIEGYQS